MTYNDNPNIKPQLEPAFKKYNEEQFITTKLPGASDEVLVSEYNRLSDGRYFDPGAQVSFAFDHVSHVSLACWSYLLQGWIWRKLC